MVSAGRVDGELAVLGGHSHVRVVRPIGRARSGQLDIAVGACLRAGRVNDQFDDLRRSGDDTVLKGIAERVCANVPGCRRISESAIRVERKSAVGGIRDQDGRDRRAARNKVVRQHGTRHGRRAGGIGVQNSAGEDLVTIFYGLSRRTRDKHRDVRGGLESVHVGDGERE